MRKRLNFEWKLFLEKKNIIVIFLISAMFFLSFGMIRPSLDTKEDLIAGWKEDLELNPISLDEKQKALESGDEHWIAAIEIAERANDLTRQLIKVLKEEDWSTYYKLEYQRKELLYEIADDKEISPMKEKEPKLYLHLKKLEAQRDYFIKKNLPITENIGNPASNWGTLSNTLSECSNFLVIMLFAILFCDFLTNSFEKSNIYLYSFTRKKKSSIIISKLLIQLSTSVIFSVLCFGLLFTVKGAIYGMGTSKYPIAIGNDVKNFSFISSPELLLRYIPYYFLVLLFLITFFLFLGAYLRKSLVSLGLFLLSYYGFTLIKDFGVMKVISPFIPYNYLDTYGVITQTDFSFSKESFLIGVLYLLVLSVIFYALTVRKMNKLEI
ncbi:hypothetical protein SAMN02745116_00289 [Pilibacter termitis]|uniref:ABC-2 type transport system permease protein n=1 Tax=Pilibacter termitis TaxID=263852 RepID=A0A1T4KM03_9ENTE|nr:hypothetical protein [Pilibacter termitis]SJZ43403.1 hypothetical protein SAMN02745116_00289 [Pilibacter termitis]